TLRTSLRLRGAHMPRHISSVCILALGLGLMTPAIGHGEGPTALTDQDRADLQELAGRYARALGTCSADEYAALFATPDGYFASGTSGKVKGRMLPELVRGQAHCINDTAIGGGPRTANTGRGNGP